MRTTTLLAMASSFAGVLAFVACGNEGLLQGDPYEPDDRIPIDPASDRSDTGTTCEGGSCDAGVDAPRDPLVDASNQPTNTCQTARTIGTIPGDTGNGVLTASGTCSEWVSLRATEDSSSVLGAPMKVKLTLDPSGGDFDLFAYFDPVRDVRSCAAPFASSFVPGSGSETIPLMWGEGSVSNGSDDGRTIAVVVLKAGGPCGPDAGSWKLTAAGNQ